MSTHCSFSVSIRVPAGGSKEEVFLQGSQAGEGWGKGIRKGCEKTVQFSRSVVSDSLLPHGLQHARLPCSSPTPRAYSNSCP